MAETKSKREAAADLRRRAEASTPAPAAAESATARSDVSMQRLIHELQVHQTELELQNEELRQARVQLEANYDELYDFAPVGYFTLGPHSNIEKVNLTGAGMLGRPRGLLLGRSFANFVRLESRPRFNQFVSRAMSGGDKESCMVTLMKGGHTPVFTYIEATRTGSTCRAVVVDITTAEQARLALRESEERLQLALAATGMGVWEWEVDSGDIYWSPECIKISGLDSVCPSLNALASLLHPQDAERVIAALRQMLADGTENSIECRIIRTDGQLAWVSIRGQAKCGEDGKPLRLIGIAQDITERKRDEQYSRPTQD